MQPRKPHIRRDRKPAQAAGDRMPVHLTPRRFNTPRPATARSTARATAGGSRVSRPCHLPRTFSTRRPCSSPTSSMLAPHAWRSATQAGRTSRPARPARSRCGWWSPRRRPAWAHTHSCTGGIAIVVGRPLNSIPCTLDGDALAVKRAVAAYLARFDATRVHTESDLRASLVWCTERGCRRYPSSGYTSGSMWGGLRKCGGSKPSAVSRRVPSSRRPRSRSAGRPRLGQLERLRQAWNELLGDRVFVLPSTAGAAPRLWAAPHAVDAHRRATMQLTCLAGITGRPAVSAPLLQVPEGPLGSAWSVRRVVIWP